MNIVNKFRLLFFILCFIICIVILMPDSIVSTSIDSKLTDIIYMIVGFLVGQKN